MKLRILKQSIRIRLTQGEVLSLGEGSPVSAELKLGPLDTQKLVYTVTPDESAALLGVDMRQAEIVITLPAGMARELAHTERVTIEEVLTQDPDLTVKVCIEKDFQCLKPRSGDQDEDSFPHPSADQEPIC